MRRVQLSPLPRAPEPHPGYRFQLLGMSQLPRTRHEPSAPPRRADPAAINRFWQSVQSSRNPVATTCPACLKPMVGIEFSTATNGADVSLDFCERCQFLWFDSHELAAIPSKPEAAPPKQLPQKARELIALHQVEKMATPRINRGDCPARPRRNRWHAHRRTQPRRHPLERRSRPNLASMVPVTNSWSNTGFRSLLAA